MPSNDYLAILANPTIARDYAASLTVYGSPNTTLGDANILAGSMKYTESTASGSEISIGTTVMSELDLTLLNLSGELNNVSLQNSALLGQVGLMVGAAREWVNLGYFIIVEALRGMKTIPIKAYDRMVLTERPYYLAGITFPCSISEALNKICLACGITTTGIAGTNSAITLEGIPESSRMTCRDAIGYLAMICGKVARFSRAGVLEFVWYGTTPIMTITPALRDSLKCDPVQISLTGVEYVAMDTNNVQTTYRAGTNNYCLSLAENPFLLGQNVQAILNGIWVDIGASSYYIFDCDLQGDPSFLATDAISIVLPDASTITTKIMTHNYSYRGHSVLSAAGRATALAKYKPAAEKQLSAIAQQEQIAVQKLTTYQQAMLQLNEFSAQSTGLYPSSETLPDGSVIYYQHDHPLRADSIFIWRQTATTFTYSADGGVTWLGYDATGNILARVLTAIGINVEWIVASGALSSADGKSFFNLSTGEIKTQSLTQWYTSNTDLSAVYETIASRMYQGGFFARSSLPSINPAATRGGKVSTAFLREDSNDNGVNFLKQLALQFTYLWSQGSGPKYRELKSIDLSNTGVTADVAGGSAAVGSNAVPLKVWMPTTFIGAASGEIIARQAFVRTVFTAFAENQSLANSEWVFPEFAYVCPFTGVFSGVFSILTGAANGDVYLSVKAPEGNFQTLFGVNTNGWFVYSIPFCLHASVGETINFSLLSSTNLNVKGSSHQSFSYRTIHGQRM